MMLNLWNQMQSFVTVTIPNWINQAIEKWLTQTAAGRNVASWLDNVADTVNGLMKPLITILGPFVKEILSVVMPKVQAQLDNCARMCVNGIATRATSNAPRLEFESCLGRYDFTYQLLQERWCDYSTDPQGTFRDAASDIGQHRPSLMSPPASAPAALPPPPSPSPPPPTAASTTFTFGGATPGAHARLDHRTAPPPRAFACATLNRWPARPTRPDVPSRVLSRLDNGQRQKGVAAQNGHHAVKQHGPERWLWRVRREWPAPARARRARREGKHHRRGREAGTRCPFHRGQTTRSERLRRAASVRRSGKYYYCETTNADVPTDNKYTLSYDGSACPSGVASIDFKCALACSSRWLARSRSSCHVLALSPTLSLSLSLALALSLSRARAHPTGSLALSFAMRACRRVV